MDNELSVRLGAALKARGYQLALAESCTGGMVAQAVTSVAGSSSWFDCGFVTYSNQAKIEMLGVRSQTLETYGAVSEKTAAEMALGALKNSQAQITGSITGIAGPDGGTADKPVGTVCFAWAICKSARKSNHETEHEPSLTTATRQFSGNREEIRQQATATMIAGLIEQLKLLA